MAHQPSVILLVKDKKAEAKALRVQLRDRKSALRAARVYIKIGQKNEAVLLKQIEKLNAQIEEVKHVPVPRQRINIAPELRPETIAALPPF